MSADEVLALVAAAFEGDPDAAEEAFTPDAEFRDQAGEPPLRGRDEIQAHFLAFGGRRERFTLGEVVRDGDRLAVEYALHFRSDAQAFAQRGVAFVTLEDGLIASWRGTWVETEEGLDAWGGD